MDTSVNASEEGTDEDTYDHSYNAVFMCAKCNSIITDSQAWDSHNEELKTLTVKYVTNKVKVTDQLTTSVESEDLGSTYCRLQCNQCGTDIGKIYKTTPRHMDRIRDLFTLNASDLDSYQIGGQNVQQCPLSLEKIPSEIDTQMSIMAQRLVELQEEVESFSHRIEKIENPVLIKNGSFHKEKISDENENNGLTSIIIGLNDRISKLEKLYSTRSHGPEDKNEDSQEEHLQNSVTSTASTSSKKSPRERKPVLDTLNRKRDMDLAISNTQRMHKKKKLT